MSDDEMIAIDLTPEDEGGVLKMLIKEGMGIAMPSKGDMVSVHYVGTLLDGTKFDSSRDRGDKFEFKLGEGQVIKAWDLCVATMKKGEICKLTCKSKYAYGDTGSPPKIKPNDTLVFEIELFSWKGEDLSPENDGGITRKVVKAGDGFTSPNDGALVKVNLMGIHEERIFYEKEDFSFNLGEGSVHDIPEGVETALLKFKLSEHSIIKLEPKYAFGSVGSEKFAIPPDAVVEYEVNLLEFEKNKEAYEMDKTEKLEQSKLLKELGTNFFKEENFSLAIKKYSKVVDLLRNEDDNESEELNLLLASRLNLSMCYLKQKNFSSAKQQADEALKLDKESIKGHFRFGMSLIGLQEPEEAMKSFQKCLQIEAGNQAARQQIKVCKNQIKQYKETEKKMYSAMFENLSK